MSLREIMAVTAALSDENRVRMLLALRQGELCVCQIIELFGLSASTTSKHLSILYQAGLVDSRKEGRWTYYSLPGGEPPKAISQAICWLSDAIKGDSRIKTDAERLRQILKTDPTDLCKRQCRK